MITLNDDESSDPISKKVLARLAGRLRKGCERSFLRSISYLVLPLMRTLNITSQSADTVRVHDTPSY